MSLTDELEEKGLEVPELSNTLQMKLRGLGMPQMASAKNPVDIGAAGLTYHLTLAKVVEMGREILRSGEVDALIFHGLGRPGMKKEREDDPAKGAFLALEVKLMRRIQALEGEFRKPVLIGCALSPWESQAVWDLNQENVRTYQRLEDLAWLLAYSWQRTKTLSSWAR